MYLPANILPVMRTSAFGNTQGETILSGVVYFLEHGDWPLALIIFVASIMVPMLKMLALTYLLLSVQRHSRIVTVHSPLWKRGVGGILAPKRPSTSPLAPLS